MVEVEEVAYEKMTMILEVVMAMEVRIMALFVGHNYANSIHEITVDMGRVCHIDFQSITS
eukprot:1505713-Ditylum_brightwellii.AAC.1